MDRERKKKRERGKLAPSNTILSLQNRQKQVGKSCD
jgi:hypothetical protein